MNLVTAATAAACGEAGMISTDVCVVCGQEGDAAAMTPSSTKSASSR